MSNPNIVKGSCLCKAVSLSTTSMNNQVGACHCSMCRKWSGGPFLHVDCGSNVSFTGEKNIGVYQSSQSGERGFCRICGSHLFFRNKQTNQYIIPVGIFDNNESLVFAYQVFIDKKPEYYSFANETKNLTEVEVFALSASRSEK